SVGVSGAHRIEFDGMSSVAENFLGSHGFYRQLTLARQYLLVIGLVDFVSNNRRALVRILAQTSGRSEVGVRIHDIADWLAAELFTNLGDYRHGMFRIDWSLNKDQVVVKLNQRAVMGFARVVLKTIVMNVRIRNGLIDMNRRNPAAENRILGIGR